jgi:BirA family biotin operon repressor/biotin-[acetyl-CoA-carboxylase] ligase
MLLNRLEHWIERWQSDGFADVLEQWVRRADWLGSPIKVRFGPDELTGTALGLTADGGLRLRDEKGHERTIHCGDVSLLLETIGRQPLPSTTSR